MFISDLLYSSGMSWNNFALVKKPQKTTCYVGPLHSTSVLSV